MTVSDHRRVGPCPTMVTMLLENDLFPQDTRVWAEAASLSRAGYGVRVIAPRGPGQSARETVKGVEVERFRAPIDHSGSRRMLLTEYAIAHLQLWARGVRAVLQGTDVLHVHNPPDTLFIPALIGRLRGCRFVFDQHDLFPELFEAKFGRSPALRLARAAQRVSLRLADLAITTSESQRDAALAITRYEEESVIIVRNGPPSTELQRAVVCRGGALSDPHIVYVGALERQDGVECLPRLLSSLIEEHHVHDPRLTIVGWGSHQQPLVNEVKARGLEDRVSFTGRVDHQRALEIIANADICLDVAPCDPLNHRTTMVKIVEYLVLGRPTISFALKETMRIAGDAVAYADCGDWGGLSKLVSEVAASEVRRRDLRERARQLAPKLVWDASERALLDAYRRLAPANRRQSSVNPTT